MAGIDLRYYDQVTDTWIAPLANGEDLKAVQVLITKLNQDVETAVETVGNMQQDVTILQQTVTQNHEEVTEHLAEAISEGFYVMRSTELAGVQTITLPSVRTPKEIKINASVILSKKISVGVWSQSGTTGGQQSLYIKEDQSTGTDGLSTVAISESSGNAIVGKIQNVSKGSFEIEWTIHGNVPSANIVLLISVLYHGGEE